jgi:hypothetical protein
MKVYILFHETNTGHGDESDGYVESVHATEAAAEAARLAALRKCRDEGRVIWLDPDDPDAADEEGPSDWEDDFHVECYDLGATDAEQRIASITAVLQTRRGEWRELNSCADAIDTIGQLLTEETPSEPYYDDDDEEEQDDERARDDDDGRTYADPRDEQAERLRD